MDLDETLHFNKNREMPVVVKDIIYYLRRNNIIIALASLNTHADMFLYQYDVLHLFDALEFRLLYEDCETQEQKKEHNSLQKDKMFQRLLERFDVKPEETLFYDDNILNILDAKSFKIKSVLVSPQKLLTWSNLRTGFQLFENSSKRRKSV